MGCGCMLSTLGVACTENNKALSYSLRMARFTYCGVLRIVTQKEVPAAIVSQHRAPGDGKRDGCVVVVCAHYC